MRQNVNMSKACFMPSSKTIAEVKKQTNKQKMYNASSWNIYRERNWRQCNHFRWEEPNLTHLSGD